MSLKKFFCLIPLLFINSVIAFPNANVSRSPPITYRTNEQNYKDMMLAGCISKAYQLDKHASEDARDTASIINYWTNYNVEKSTGKNDKIIDQFLAQTYHTKHAYKSSLALLKCLDMYHSIELQRQVDTYVLHPNK